MEFLWLSQSYYFYFIFNIKDCFVSGNEFQKCKMHIFWIQRGNKPRFVSIFSTIFFFFLVCLLLVFFFLCPATERTNTFDQLFVQALQEGRQAGGRLHYQKLAAGPDNTSDDPLPLTVVTLPSPSPALIDRATSYLSSNMRDNRERCGKTKRGVRDG